MKSTRVSAMARKEFFHIFRDPFTMAMALLFPVLLTTLFGLAIEFNVKNIPLAIFDEDKTQASRELIDILSSSKYFLVDTVHSQSEALERVHSEKSRAALIIPPQFEYLLRSGREAHTQALLDGSDNSTIGSVMGYLGIIQQSAAEKILQMKIPKPINVQTRFLYNPELNSRWFVVPGLMVVVVSILSILLTALTVAREWENGSMEMLLTTPATPLEIICGKLFPYLILALGGVGFVYLMARLFFAVPFRGSHFVFLIGSLLFLATYLAQGLLISVLTRKQQLAMQFSMMSGLLPSLLLSGFIFPVESMPKFFYYFTAILPARWFMVISRDVFLKGAGFEDLKTPFLALFLICLVMVSIAVRKFKKDLEP
jgi:ABC-2 type transport system permease protein